jgi:serine/threonine protein kinase
MSLVDDIGSNFHNKNRPIAKGLNRQSSNEDFGEDATREQEDDGENEGGPVENLMEPGKKISLDDFIRLKVIGRGSFGKVYLVRKRDTGLCYAMKILKKDQLIKKNLLIKTQGELYFSSYYYIAERDILEKIKNPYIVGLHFAF